MQTTTTSTARPGAEMVPSGDQSAAGSTDVLFLIRSLDLGGAERQLTTLAIGLHRLGRRVVVATYYAGGPLAADLDRAGVRVVELGKRSRWDVVRFMGSLMRLIRRERPRVVHSYLTDANVLATLACAVVPGTSVVWGIRSAALAYQTTDRLLATFFSMSRFLARYASAIVANSDAGRDYHVARGYPAARIQVIPNGISTARFRPDPEARALERRRLGITESDILVGLIARVDPIKNHHLFVQAAARVAARQPRLRFICAGDGDQRLLTDLQARAVALGLEGRVIWEPGRTDPVPLFNALDLAVSASRSEGFSNVIAEAMSCGVPCIVTDVGDSAIIVGPTGLVVPSDDIEAMAEALEAAVANLTNDVAWRSDVRRRIEERFSVEALVERTDALLAAAAVR